MQILRDVVLRLLLVNVFVCLAASLAAQDGKVAFADFGHAWLTSLGEKEPPPLPELLDRHFVRVSLGEFELQVPKSMLDTPAGLNQAAAIADTLVDLEDRLAEWTTKDAAELKTVRADLAALKKALAAWHAHPTKNGLPSLAGQGSPCVLVLAQDRRAFVAFVGWLGLWKPLYKDFWWHDDTAQFSDLRLQDEGQVQVLALEYAAPKQNGDVTLGFDMNTREKTGLLQHVLQRASMSWCWRTLGEDLDVSFVLGLATSLVVDVLGQNNARSGGSGKSNTTEGQGGFIPGAPGAGGGMPVQNADSAWRRSLGQDWFARVLRQAQKAGERQAPPTGKDKLGNFLLHDQADQKKQLVTAPFLGKAAMDREVVLPAFLDDYLEFHRGYRAGFVHWLQQNGMKTKAASGEQFAVLMRRIIAQPKGANIDALCKEVYGLSLSERDPTVDTLERRFLAWIVTSAK